MQNHGFCRDQKFAKKCHFHVGNVIKGQLNNTATWCTISKAEYNKCMALSRAVDREIYAFGSDYVSLTCKFATNKDECMTLLDFEKAHLTTLDSGEVFVGGRYHSLVPIMQEIYDSGLNYQYAVAVVKKGSLSNVNSLYDLRGKKACFAGVGTLAGWITPIFNVNIVHATTVLKTRNAWSRFFFHIP